MLELVVEPSLREAIVVIWVPEISPRSDLTGKVGVGNLGTVPVRLTSSEVIYFRRYIKRNNRGGILML
jgi:hypothetical protein